MAPQLLENQILKQEVHLGQDITAQIPDLKQWLDIGLVKNGNMYNKVTNNNERSYWLHNT